MRSSYALVRQAQHVIRLSSQRMYIQDVGLANRASSSVTEVQSFSHLHGGPLVDSLIHRTEHLMGDASEDVTHVVAYSGGVDSSLVVSLLGQAVASSHSFSDARILAVLGRSPAVSQEQVDQARSVVESLPAAHAIEYQEVETSEGTHPLYVENAGQACYACKTNLYTSLQAVASHVDKMSSSQSVRLYNGTNADDTDDPTRVGLLAAKEFQVISPLQNISKQQVRLAAKHLGLSNWNAAAAPCLRSRLALNVQATRDNLNMIELAERRVRELLGDQLRPSTNLRVRLLTKQRARIEIDGALVDYISQNLPKISPYFVELGFSSLSVTNFRTGSVSRQEAEVQVQVA